MSKLTLNEAIKHCFEVAENNEQLASGKWIGSEGEANRQECEQCAANHRQMAEWLSELKDLRNYINCMAYSESDKQSEWVISSILGGQQFYNCKKCGCSVIDHEAHSFKYCPHCGRSMETKENNTAPSDFETFKKFFDLMGIKYKIPADNLIYLSGFEVNSSQLIVIKFYEDGSFQEFCPYPEAFTHTE